MIRKTFSAEFESDGVEVVREKVARRAYKDNEKHEQAIKWLDQRDPARKTYSEARKTYGAAKKQLTLARRAAREIRLTLAVTVIILVVLGLVLAKLYTG
jgi:hypothetical protein